VNSRKNVGQPRPYASAAFVHDTAVRVRFSVPLPRADLLTCDTPTAVEDGRLFVLGDPGTY
jgi:hypothetical protein